MLSTDNLLTMNEEEEELNGRRRSKHSSTQAQTFLPDPPNGPRIFVKLRPDTNYEKSPFQVLPDGKTLQLTSIGQTPRLFTSNGIFQNDSSEDVYSEAVDTVIEKAMTGISGIVLSLGSEGAGQGFTFYGDMAKYENRGILPRAFEKVFELTSQRSKEIKYSIRVGIIEVWKDKIRDLISLSPYELKSVGDNGPNGMVLQPIDCAEHGYALLMRALAGQNLLAQTRAHAKSHIIVFINIEGQRVLSEEEQLLITNQEVSFRSRITFAKIASLPQRAKDADQISVRPGSAMPMEQANENVIESSNGCYFITPQVTPRSPADVTRGQDGPGQYYRISGTQQACCSEKSGPLAEGISVRRDLLFLEQMFIRVSELQKLQRYYHKLKFVGMQGIMRNPNLAPSQYFRQNKLCHCLRDLVCSRNEIRIILHIRPEPEYLPTVLEILRFVDRLRLIPRNPKDDGSDFTGDKLSDLNSLRQEIRVLREELERMARSIELAEDGLGISDSRYALLQNQASEYVNGTLHQLEIDTKAEAKVLFENLRALFQTAVAEASLGRKGSKKSDLKSNKSNSFSKEAPAKDKSEKDLGKKVKRAKSTSSTKRKKGRKKQDSKFTIPLVETVETEPALEVPGEVEEDPGESTAQVDGLEQIIEVMGFVSKAEALEAFGTTEIGTRLAGEVSLNDTLLEEKTQEHTSALQVTTDFLKQLASKQSELEAIQQARHAKGDEYDTAGNIIIGKAEKDALIELRVMEDNRDQVLATLKSVKLELQRQKLILGSSKAEFETQFQIFCFDRFAGVREDGEGESETQLESDVKKVGSEEGAFCNIFTFRPTTAEVGQDLARNFDILKRTAQDQAKAIVKYYQHPPAWRKY